MTPLPGSLGGTGLVAWRLDEARHAPTWDAGEGAYRFGGRWNRPGVRAVYAALDPATSILEVAAHKRFQLLDTTPHVLTAFEVLDPSSARILRREDVPNPSWLRPGEPSAGQQAFGSDLLQSGGCLVLPSVVSTYSWNLVFAPLVAGQVRVVLQERFALDTRLHPPG